MHVAFLASTLNQAFPKGLGLAGRMAPILRGLAQRGHQVTVIHYRRDADLSWTTTIPGVRLVPASIEAKRTDAPRTSGRAAEILRQATHGIGQSITGMEVPPKRAFAASIGEISGDTIRAESIGGRHPLVGQALSLGADVVIGGDTIDFVDLAISTTCSIDATQRACLASVSSAVAWSDPVHAALCDAGFRDRAFLVRIPPDPQLYSPDLEPEGQRVREALGIDVDAMACLWLPSTSAKGGAIRAAQAFAALASSSGRAKDKLRLILPDVEGAEISKAIGMLNAANLSNLVIRTNVSSPNARFDSGTGSIPWNLLCSAANVGISLSPDEVGCTVYEALASGCSVVALSSNSAASLLRPGASGESLSIQATDGEIAGAVARLLATERAQRSRPFVAMAGHLPPLQASITRWEGALATIVERKILALAGIPPKADPLDLIVASARRLNDSTPAPVHTTAHPIRVAFPAKPEPERWVEQATAVCRTPGFVIESLLRSASLHLPGDAWVPPPENIVTQDDESLKAIWRVPVGGGRERLFVHSKPGAIHSKVWFRDPVAGDREYALFYWLAACKFSCAHVLASGSDGRRSFLVMAEAPGLPLADFLKQSAMPSSDAGRLLRSRVFESLGRWLADLHGLGVYAGGLEASDVYAAIEPTGDVRLTLATAPRAVRNPSGLPLELALRDLAWFARSLPTGATLGTPHRARKIRDQVDATDAKPMAAGAIDVARAIGPRSQTTRGMGITFAPVETPWANNPEGITRTSFLRILRAWCARRGLGERPSDILPRLAPLFTTEGRRREAMLDRQRESRDMLARERVARGELVPVKLSEI